MTPRRPDEPRRRRARHGCATLQAARPAGARRPHPGLRLRLRAGRGRRGRAARRSRRTPRSNGLDPTAFPSPAADGERPGRLRRRPARRARRRRRDGDLRRHRVGPARRAGRPRRPPGHRPTRAWCCRRPRTRRSTRPRTTSACAPVLVDVDRRTSAPTRPRWPRADRRHAPCWSSPRAPVVRPRRRRPGHRDRGAGRRARHPLPRRRLHRRLGAAVRRTARPHVPPWTFAVDGRHQHLGRPAQVRLHAQGRLGAAAPHPGAARGRSSSPRRTGRATRCSTRRCSRPGPAGRSPRRGRWSSDRRRGVRRPGPAGARRRRSTGRDRGGRHRRACACWPRPTRPWSPSSPTARCDVFTIADEMLERGWYVQPQLSFRGVPPTLHLTLSRGDRTVGARARRGPARVGRGRARRRPGRRRPRARRPSRVARPGDPRRRGLRRAARRGRPGRQRRRPRPPRPDGRGQRPARRLPAPRCARRCCSGCSTGCRARPPAEHPAPPHARACPRPAPPGIGWAGSSTAAGRTPMAPETHPTPPCRTRSGGTRRRCSSRPSATTSTRRWRGCPTARRSSTARPASG